MGKNNDRLFIDKFDNFIFSVRRMLYYGDTNKGLQPKDPKHERLRFIRYFGTNDNYYNSKNYSFYFSDDDKLKDEFSNIFTYKSLSTSEMGDYIQLFSKLSEDKSKTIHQLISESFRNEKNFSRRIEPNSELANSGSVLTFKKSPKEFKRNCFLTTGLTDNEKQKFANALNFAIKKNNFVSFASTYKKLLEVNYGIKEDKTDISIDHQLFNPILDELHIWTVVSAITEQKSVNIKYCIDFPNTMIDINSIVPVKIIYDNIYGRSYLIGITDEKYSIYRFDRIFHCEIGNKFEYTEKIDYIEKVLKTAWLVSLNDETETVKIRFKNTPAILARIQNEGRHGKITQIENEYFIYEIEVNDSTEMINWILGYGDNCVVLEPQNLVDKIISRLEEIAL